MDFHYDPELALKYLADRIAELEHANAVLRSAVTYYQSLIPPQDFAQVPHSPQE